MSIARIGRNRRKARSQRRVDRKYLKEIGGDSCTFDAFRFAGAGAVQIDAFKSGDVLKRLCLSDPFDKVGV